MMVAFSGRPVHYQVSVVLLLLATLAFCLGLALPWWTQTYSKSTQRVSSHSGLWLYCSLYDSQSPQSSEEKCRFIDAPGWFRVVQGMQGAGLVEMLAASVYALVVNFCMDRTLTSRALETLAGLGGALGIISATLYITKTSPILQHNHATTYSWALSIDFAASILTVFIAIIIALSNRRPSVVDEATTIIVEDCGGQVEGKDTRSRSPEKRRAGRRGVVEMERSPARTRRLEAVSETFVSLEEDDEEEEEEEEVEEVDDISRGSFSYVDSLGKVSS